MSSKTTSTEYVFLPFCIMMTSDAMIELLVAALPDGTTERDKHIYREALQGLVRLAQVEQIVSLHQDFQAACLAASRHYTRRV